MQKKLIINPTKSEAQGLVVLNPNDLKRELTEKVMKTTESGFKKTLFRSSNLGLLVQNVEPKVVGVSAYIDRELNTFSDALAYVDSVASSIYGADWSLRLIKNEVMYNRAPGFAVRIDSDETVQKVQDMLKYVADVQVREPKRSKAKDKKDDTHETKEESNEQQS